MKELRFRAWIVEKERESRNRIREPFMTDSFSFNSFDENYFIDEGCNLDEMTIMQYQGFKDKNKKEICEGDNLKFKHLDEEYQYCEVEAFGIIKGDFGDWNEWTLKFAIDSDYVFEIIGNIYENSELRKE